MPHNLTTSWYCHQLGSREHYSIPRALYQNGQLGLLQVDAWATPAWRLVWRGLRQCSLAGRFHPDLDRAKIRAFTFDRLRFDSIAKMRASSTWQTVMDRNEWFQRRCIPGLRRELSKNRSKPSIVFSYSYTARKLFLEAKRHSAQCVLGQIDPGPEEFRWVAKQLRDSGGAPDPEPPAEYWKLWREEVELADRILINSEWSMELLERSGVPSPKMRIVPLAYERSNQAQDFVSDAQRNVSMPQIEGNAGPQADARRLMNSGPLRVLFLGQLIARKGVFPLFQAIERLQGAPIFFDLAGPIGVEIPDAVRKSSQVKLHGPVSRSVADLLYKSADVFILPTFSDGFAITQLEAAAHRLPMIVSAYCGKVITDGVNGIVLHEVSADAIFHALNRFLHDPKLSPLFVANAPDLQPFSLNQLGIRLAELSKELIET